MNKFFFIVFIGWSSFEAQSLNNNVYLKNNTLHYYGKITENNNEELFTAYHKASKKPSRLKITSKGGDIKHGMALGKFVWKNKLDIEVGEYCLSSCANYVFTAGKRKILNQTSTLGWHGGAASENLI
ncbi:MAG: hypothetical protein AAGB12_13635 [Pseudomonadota bacterium]